MLFPSLLITVISTSVAIHSSAQGSVAMQSGQSVSAGTSVAIDSEQNANANDIGPVQCQTTSSLYNGTGSVSSLTSGGTATVYVQEGSVDLNVITTDADVKIEGRTQSSAPSVNVTTGGGDVRVARAEGDTNPILAKVNLTVTEGLLEGQALFVRGAFASLTHKGVGDVIMESADTSVANLIKLGTGGLTRAYQNGVKEALALLPVTEKKVFVRASVRIGYAYVDRFYRLLPRFQARVAEEAFDEAARFTLEMPEECLEPCRLALSEATDGSGQLAPEEE